MMNMVQRIIIATGAAVLVLLVFAIPKTYTEQIRIPDYNPISKSITYLETIQERFDNRRMALEALTVAVATAGLVFVFKDYAPAKNNDEDELA